MIVVDTNVVAYLLLPSAPTAAAEALLQREPQWAAPLLWRSEFRNLLAGYLRRGTIAFGDALRIQEEAETLLADAEYEVDSASVLRLVHDSDCSAHDCEFVALAERMNTVVVTADAKLLRAFPQSTRPFPARG